MLLVFCFPTFSPKTTLFALQIMVGDINNNFNHWKSWVTFLLDLLLVSSLVTHSKGAKAMT